MPASSPPSPSHHPIVLALVSKSPLPRILGNTAVRSFELLKWLVAKVERLRSPSSQKSVKALSDLKRAPF